MKPKPEAVLKIRGVRIALYFFAFDSENRATMSVTGFPVLMLQRYVLRFEFRLLQTKNATAVSRGGSEFLQFVASA